jgi:hypothetical protein
VKCGVGGQALRAVPDVGGQPPEIDGLPSRRMRHFRSLTFLPRFVKAFKAAVQSAKMVEVKSARVRTAR